MEEFRGWMIKQISTALEPYFEWNHFDEECHHAFRFDTITVKKNIGPFLSGDRLSWIDLKLGKEGDMDICAWVFATDHGRGISTPKLYQRLLDDGFFEVYSGIICVDLAKDIPINLFITVGNQKL